MNDLENLEARLLKVMDEINEINHELIKNHAGAGSKDLNRAYSATSSARSAVTKEIALQR